MKDILNNMAQLSNHLNCPRTYIKTDFLLLLTLSLDIWAEGGKHVNVTDVAGFTAAILNSGELFGSMRCKGLFLTPVLLWVRLWTWEQDC